MLAGFVLLRLEHALGWGKWQEVSTREETDASLQRLLVCFSSGCFFLAGGRKRDTCLLACQELDRNDKHLGRRVCLNSPELVVSFRLLRKTNTPTSKVRASIAHGLQSVFRYDRCRKEGLVTWFGLSKPDGK